MFIHPLTLFIIGEILVVYIIINIFLFYKSRLYNVLVALLKEMRFEKLRREQEKQNELNKLRATNKGLLDKTENLEATVKSAGKTINEQIHERIVTLTEKYPHALDLTNSIERDQSVQWLRLRLLELEKELLNGNLSEERWQELAKEAIARLSTEELAEKNNTIKRKDSAETDRYIGQLETDLEEATRLFQDSKIRINQLEGELEDLKTINTPTDSHLEKPTSGLYEDEIYRLKCDNFDMQESINKLKLELQQADPGSANDAFISLLEAQISNMEQYIKTADIAAGLMEKEANAAQLQINELTEKLSNLGTAPSTVDISALNSLSDQQHAKNDTVSSIKETIARLMKGEDPEVIAAEQDAHIARLEQIIRESEQCISVLESELSRSSEAMKAAKDENPIAETQQLSEKLNGLNTAQTGQKQGMSNIKSLIDNIRAGGDMDELLTQQEAEITTLERFLSESEMIVSQLENEIDELNNKLNMLNSMPNESTTSERPDSNEDIEEMEILLQQFISDIQGLMKHISLLENENTELKKTTSTNSTPEAQSTPETSTQVNDDDSATEAEADAMMNSEEKQPAE